MTQNFSFPKILFSVLVILVVFIVIRSLFYFRQSQKLFSISQSFSRDYYLGDPTNPPLLYVAMGDSTTEGTGATTVKETVPFLVAEELASHGNYVHVRNLGQSGAKIKDLLSRQLPTFITLQPNLVSVQIGANDATHFTNLSDYQISLQTLISVLQKSGATRIIYTTAPDMDNAPALFLPYNLLVGKRAAQQNILLQKAATESSLPIADIYTNGKLDYWQDHSLYATDRFHPSSLGYKKWANIMGASL